MKKFIVKFYIEKIDLNFFNEKLFFFIFNEKKKKRLECLLVRGGI
jgi:hypothetical protein